MKYLHSLLNQPIKFCRWSNGLHEHDHFVFKAGYMHGDSYIDKNQFLHIGPHAIFNVIGDTVRNAAQLCFNIGQYPEVGVMTPAYGAIPFSLAVAWHLEEIFPSIRFFPARTELETVAGRKVHRIPKKFIEKYKRKPFIVFEDIVNNGTTCREVKGVLENQAGAEVIAVICLLNRGGQTAETLGVEQFFPRMELTLPQWDLRTGVCPECEQGVPINTKIGKGQEWVNMFGQPPYPEGTDFSAFWKEAM